VQQKPCGARTEQALDHAEERIARVGNRQGLGQRESGFEQRSLGRSQVA
jgi:hypothetical protein